MECTGLFDLRIATKALQFNQISMNFLRHTLIVLLKQSQRLYFNAERYPLA